MRVIYDMLWRNSQVILDGVLEARMETTSVLGVVGSARDWGSSLSSVETLAWLGSRMRQLARD